MKVVNKPKIQGTRFESKTRDLLLDWGYKAYRLAEGGLKDEGDVQVEIDNGILPKPEIVFECKARQNLNIHQTYYKATQKTDKPVILAWKKLVKKAGQKKRSADGVDTLYIINEDLMKELLRNYGRQ